MKHHVDLVVMDWGIGGLSVYNEIRARQPELSILYFSDSGNMPYGKMPSSRLRARVREIVLRFAAEGVRHFVVACNAASTVLPGLAREFKRRELNVAGVIEHGVGLIERSKFRHVGVIGGKRTILSRHYTRPFATGASRANQAGRKKLVVGRIAQPLSALIEAGDLDSAHMRATLDEILRPLKTCDALVLACTHYPAVAPLIQEILPGCRLLDPADATARYVKLKWKFKPASRARQIFMTSGSSAGMIRSARLAFGTRIASVTQTK